MITSNKIVSICERFVSYAPAVVGKPVPVYENPNSSDYIYLYKYCEDKEIKFLADNLTKKVYVWEAYALHDSVSNTLGILSRLRKEDPNLLTGDAKLVGGKAVMNGSDDFYYWMQRRDTYKKKIQEILKIDWSWVNTYVDCKNYMSKLKSDFERTIK